MKRAIVIGGSVGGLLAARVLADHCEQVTIVDRDRFPAVGEQRRGVPQGRHTHGLLAGGRRVLDELFPGISDTLIARGALDGDIIYGSRWFIEGAASHAGRVTCGACVSAGPYWKAPFESAFSRLETSQRCRIVLLKVWWKAAGASQG